MQGAEVAVGVAVVELEQPVTGGAVCGYGLLERFHAVVLSTVVELVGGRRLVALRLVLRDETCIHYLRKFS